MISYVLASLALFGASASASSSCGSAKVINSCPYEVYMQNTPSSGGGYSEIDKTLQSGDSYEQEYTALSNGNGWSMKLSKVEGSFQSEILQYEYTYQNAGTIWFDLSCVNGDWLDGDWHISAASPATNGCNPGQVPYTYPTEDKVVPEVSQSCTSDNSIILNLCSSNSSSSSGSGSESGSGSGSGSGSSAAQSSQAAASSQAPSSQAANTPATYAAPASSPSAAAHQQGPIPLQAEYFEHHAAAATTEAAASPTTFATVVTSGPAEVIVTDIQTAVVTNYVTAYAERVKPRHEHHPHGHQHNA